MFNMTRAETEVDSSRGLRLGELLVRDGKISPRDLDQALLAQTEMGDLLGRVIVRLGLLSEAEVVRALSEQGGYPLVSSSDFPSEVQEVVGLQPEYLISHGILPLSVRDDALDVAMAVPQNDTLLKALRLATGKEVRARIALESELHAALDRLYRVTEEESLPGTLTQLDESADSEFVEHLRDLASEAPVIRLVNQLISRVVDLRASDIHIEPFEDGLHLRYRVDGVLQTAEVADAGLAAAVTSRIKLLANLNIAERRLPQDGRIQTRVKGHQIDLRVSALPTVHGESVVMRVLDRASIRLELDQMGFSDDTLTGFRQLIERPHGILLVTGPTGSGKTTTLYAALAKLDAVSSKILSVEDPVEYQLAGVNQVQVLPQIGMTFANALRSILRQDPDIIMIGEMRDTETAQIAVQSALTGHLVLSTLHTNNAASAVIRLEDMGVERYLITSTVSGVLAQRLVRKLCPHCRRPAAHSHTAVKRFRFDALLPVEQPTLFEPVGCEQCRGTGYLGRTSIHELFVLDDNAQNAILEGADAGALHRVARRSGMRTLYEDGLLKAARGLTSLEEVLRVTQDQERG